MLKNDESPIAQGKRLKVLRTMTGLNRLTLAKKANVSITSISYWEHGKGSPMTPRSMQKIIQTMREEGIICSEEWLKTGNGLQPTSSQQNKKYPTEKMPLNFDIESFSFSEEINLFVTTMGSNSVIMQLENNSMFPVFEKGDIVGGLFLPTSSLDFEKDKICIVKIETQLDIRRVRKGPQPFHFDLSYICYDAKCFNHFEMNNIKLDILAPVLRLWR